MKNKIIIAVILILIGIVLFQYFTRPTPADYSEYIKIGSKEYILLSKTKDTVWIPGDTIKVPYYTPIPGDIVYVPVPTDIDTTAILQRYFATRFYSDTVPLDSIGTVQIKDSISKNQIVSRSLIFNYSIPIITETIMIESKLVNKFYLGGGINFDSSNFINSAYVSGLFKTKKDKIFAVNIGSFYTDSSIKPYIGGALYWRINFKRK